MSTATFEEQCRKGIDEYIREHITQKEFERFQVFKCS
jgi:hypothetical protein